MRSPTCAAVPSRTMEPLRAVFRSVCIVAAVGEVVGAFLWRVEVEDAADGVPEAVDGALSGLTQMRLQLGKGLLDRVEIGTVGREERMSGVKAGGFDVRLRHACLATMSCLQYVSTRLDQLSRRRPRLG